MSKTEAEALEAAARLPDRPLLKPDEIVDFLGGAVGRRQLYDALNAYMRTGGAEGIPAVRIGRSIRIPRTLFLMWLRLDTPVDQRGSRAE